MNKKQAVIVGSLTRDRIEAHRHVQECIGGVVWHAGTTLAKLGIKTCAVTRIAAVDRELAVALLDSGVQVRWHRSAETTTFANSYFDDNPNERIQYATALADPIETEELLRALVDADLAYLGPLHPRDLADDFPGVFCTYRPPIVALDIQGYTRAIRKGCVVPSVDDRLFSVLHVCDVIKASEEEARLLTGSCEPPDAALQLASSYPGLEVLVTCGGNGAYLVQHGKIHYEPAVRVDVPDPTGAGDVYFASYLGRRLSGASIEVATKFAAKFTAERLVDPSRTLALHD